MYQLDRFNYPILALEAAIEEAKITEVRLDEIITDAQWQKEIRPEGLDEIAVANLSFKLEWGAVPDPIILARLKNQEYPNETGLPLFLADGWHRVAAYRRMRSFRPEMKVRVKVIEVENTDDIGVLTGLMNTRDKLRLTPQGKRGFFGFVIKTGRHRLLNGERQFIGWRGLGRIANTKHEHVKRWLTEDFPEEAKLIEAECAAMKDAEERKKPFDREEHRRRQLLKEHAELVRLQTSAVSTAAAARAACENLCRNRGTAFNQASVRAAINAHSRLVEEFSRQADELRKAEAAAKTPAYKHKPASAPASTTTSNGGFKSEEARRAVEEIQQRQVELQRMGQPNHNAQTSEQAQP